jgi:crotonobetainyl-CoA:carnitine CoA-transferase CaiB-like acyl-CoA transferase
VNERIILINMPALGATGPYRHAAGYGTIVEGMGGLGSLFGAPEEGARISQTYYPDPVAGLHASLAALSMLERRDATGEGGEVDLSHQEILWLQLGEALVAAGQGRDLERVGNRVPGCATSGVFATRDGRWLAVASVVDCDDLVAGSAERDCDALLATLAERGASATEVLHYAEARKSAALSATIETVHHDVTLDRPYLRVPLWLDGTALDTRRPSPVFDTHTREVLAEWLGCSEADLDAIVATGAVGGAPDPEELRAFYLGRASR